MNECIKIIIISVYKIITSCDAFAAIMVVLIYLRACVIKLVSECLVPSIFFIIAHTYENVYYRNNNNKYIVGGWLQHFFVCERCSWHDDQ